MRYPGELQGPEALSIALELVPYHRFERSPESARSPSESGRLINSLKERDPDVLGSWVNAVLLRQNLHECRDGKAATRPER